MGLLGVALLNTLCVGRRASDEGGGGCGGSSDALAVALFVGCGVVCLLMTSKYTDFFNYLRQSAIAWHVHGSQ